MRGRNGRRPPTGWNEGRPGLTHDDDERVPLQTALRLGPGDPEALEELAEAEAEAARHGELAGPVLETQRPASARIDTAQNRIEQARETWRQRSEDVRDREPRPKRRAIRPRADWAMVASVLSSGGRDDA